MGNRVEKRSPGYRLSAMIPRITTACWLPTPAFAKNHFRVTMSAMRSNHGRSPKRMPPPNGVTPWVNVAGKAMSHPARVTILQAMSKDGNTSPRNASSATSVSLASCSHHMRALAAMGLIRVTRTRQVRGALEHFYELTRDGQAAVRAIEAVAAIAPAQLNRLSQPRV